MRRVRLSIIAPKDFEPLAVNGRVTDLGVLVQERIASLAIDWPEIGFQRIDVSEAGVEIELVFHNPVPRCARDDEGQ